MLRCLAAAAALVAVLATHANAAPPPAGVGVVLPPGDLVCERDAMVALAGTPDSAFPEAVQTYVTVGACRMLVAPMIAVVREIVDAGLDADVGYWFWAIELVPLDGGESVWALWGEEAGIDPADWTDI